VRLAGGGRTGIKVGNEGLEKTGTLRLDDGVVDVTATDGKEADDITCVITMDV